MQTEEICFRGSRFNQLQMCELVILLILFVIKSPGQISVASYGASGDAATSFVTTVSNSPVVMTTNTYTSADIGKVIKLFRVGKPVYHNSSLVVTQQDIICFITNVTHGTNLSISIPPGVTASNVYCVTGTNNAVAFQAAVNAATNGTVLTIPAGKYLVISTQALDPNYVMAHISDGHPAVRINKGGITFRGDSADNTILMGCGAGMVHQVSGSLSWINPNYAPYVPYRGYLFWFTGPITNSAAALVFENLVFDGGLTNGLQNYNYWTPIQANGDGWDTTHGAVLDWAASDVQMHQLKVFTNCVFQHWRGEMVKSTVGKGGTNTLNIIANSIFQDGNASAINLYFGQHVHGCSFSNLVKVQEFYQANSTLPTIFENNNWTNIKGSPFTIVGATTNANPPSFTIRNNVMAGASGAQITFSPAQNVTVVSNTLYGNIPAISMSAAGLQPSDGTAATISNIVVAHNTMLGNSLSLITDGYQACDVAVSNNTSVFTSTFAILGGGYKGNFVFRSNSGGLPVDSRSITSPHWPVDDISNDFGPRIINQGGASNFVTYALGGRYRIQFLTTNTVIYLDELQPQMIPVGAMIQITNLHSLEATIRTTSDPNTNLKSLGRNEGVTFYWSNQRWTLQGRLTPPSALRVENP